MAIWRTYGEGLIYLHRHSLAHCDIKPANLLLDLKKRCLKICDFGLAIDVKHPWRGAVSAARSHKLS